MCIALATAFALKYQCFNIKYKLSPCVQVILDHSKYISNGYGLFASRNKRLANLPTKFIFLFIFFYKVYRPIWSLKKKMRLGIGLVLSPIVFSKVFKYRSSRITRTPRDIEKSSSYKKFDLSKSIHCHTKLSCFLFLSYCQTVQ